MKTEPVRLLFIVHSASRNGASILLLNWIKWAREKVDWKIDVLVRGRGPLVKDFKRCAKTIVWRYSDEVYHMLPHDWRSKIRLIVETTRLKIMLRNRKYDLIYINSAAHWHQIDSLSKLCPSMVLHIHELGYALKLIIGKNWVQCRQILDSMKKIIAVSDSVKNTLIKEFGVAKNKIDLIHGFTLVETPVINETKTERKTILESLKWPEESFVIGSVGSLGWRKGSDLFIQIARACLKKKKCENFKFLWIGGQAYSDEALQFNYDVKALGMENCCVMIPSTSDIMKFYQAMDVFALVSREDPFPIVMLEAASYKLPMVCFSGAGGGLEFARDDAGLIAPYLDIASFVEHLVALHDSDDLRKKIGEKAYMKVKGEFNIEVQGPKLLKTIMECL